MDLATFVVAAIIIVLQVITLAVVLGDRKKRAAVPPLVSREEDRTRGPREPGRDRYRRPGQQQPGGQEQRARRPEAPAPAPVATPVDKSLRDINLRLKTAERDQDRARREVRGNTIGGDGPQARTRDRGERPERGERTDRFDRGDRGRRPDRRGDRRERDNRPRPPFQREVGALPGAVVAPQAAPSEMEQKEPRDFAPAAPTAPEATFTPPPAEIAAQEQETRTPSSAEETESIEHGRKFVVKRRELRGSEEGSEGETAPVAEPQGGEAAAAPTPESAPSAPAAEESSEAKSETIYGRR